MVKNNMDPIIKEYLDEIIFEYQFRFNDLFFEKFYVENENNIREKVDGLRWSLKNDKTIINYKDVEKVCELYDPDIRWDL